MPGLGINHGAPQSSDSDRDRLGTHQGSLHETQLPAMVSSSAHQNASYDPYTFARTLPANIAAQRGEGHVSSNIGSFQPMDHILLADFIRQAEEVSHTFNSLQHDLRAHSHLQAQTDPRYTTTWVPTPPVNTP
jgi:hypothetical protein